MSLNVRRKFIELVIHKLAIAREKNFKPGWSAYEVMREIAENAEFNGIYFSELQYLARRLGYRPKWAEYRYDALDSHLRLGLFPGHTEQTQSKSRRRAKSSRSAYADPLGDALTFFGLNRPYNERELKVAYRSLAIKYHPDTGGSHEQFLTLQTHYEVLQRHVAIGV
jgi:hypothetical protein